MAAEREATAAAKPCPECDGTGGEYWFGKWPGYSEDVTWQVCEICGGSGTR